MTGMSAMGKGIEPSSRLNSLPGRGVAGDLEHPPNPLWLAAPDRPITAKMPFGLMGILNLTPDSFYDGGQTTNALELAVNLLKAGADILDLGAESTRPGATPLDSETEIGRLLAPLAAIRRALPRAVVSVDTMRAKTADLALKMGASIINDVSACAVEPALLDVLAERKPAYVLTHNPIAIGSESSRKVHIATRLKRFFAVKLGELVRAGLPEEHVALDPGIGFGKNLEENVAILGKIREFAEFGRPLLVGLSMKSFFGELLGLSLADRGESTAIASVLCWQGGVFWHRAHNVARVRNALFLASALTPEMGLRHNMGTECFSGNK